MQAEEGDDIFVLIVDETYGGDEETYISDSDNYRRQLERDFQVSFAPANIGAGADIPSFLTIIATAPVPVWAIVLSLFFWGSLSTKTSVLGERWQLRCAVSLAVRWFCQDMELQLWRWRQFWKK